MNHTYYWLLLEFENNSFVEIKKAKDIIHSYLNQSCEFGIYHHLYFENSFYLDDAPPFFRIIVEVETRGRCFYKLEEEIKEKVKYNNFDFYSYDEFDFREGVFSLILSNLLILAGKKDANVAIIQGENIKIHTAIESHKAKMKRSNKNED